MFAKACERCMATSTVIVAGLVFSSVRSQHFFFFSFDRYSAVENTERHLHNPFKLSGTKVRNIRSKNYLKVRTKNKHKQLVGHEHYF